MAATDLFRRSVMLITAATMAGCVVLPSNVYVADSTEGVPVYEKCSLTPGLPAGVKLERSGLHAIVSVVQSQGVNQVRVQFDVPDGMTMLLSDHAIAVDARDGRMPRRVSIPHINPVAPARNPETPAIQELVLPVGTPLCGGRINAGNRSSGRHYWIAAPVPGDLPGDVWISLPELLIDGTPTRIPEIRFTRRFAIGRGLFNC